MNTFLKFYNALGNSKGQKFFRFFLLVITIGIITVAIINVGYNKEKGFYWMPADIHYNKK